MEKPDQKSTSARVRAYRQRLAEAGRQEIMFELPRETIAFLDALKEHHGLRNRSQVLLQLIEQGRGANPQIA